MVRRTTNNNNREVVQGPPALKKYKPTMGKKFVRKNNPILIEVDQGRVSKGAFKANTGILGVTLTAPVNGPDPSVGNNAFQYCERLAHLDAPENVTYGRQAFMGTGFETFTLSRNATKVGDGMLKKCKVLTTYVHNSTITSIPAEYLYGCIQLTTIDVKNAVHINAGALEGCVNLRTIDFADDTTYIGPRAARRSGIEHADLSNTKVTKIMPGTFEGCTNLTEATLFGETTQLDVDCFKDSALATFHGGLPDGLQSVGTGALQNTQLTEIIFPDSMVFIGPMACANNAVLAHVRLPLGAAASPVDCHSSAFENCPNLRQATISGSIAIYSPALGRVPSLTTLRLVNNGVEIRVDIDRGNNVLSFTNTGPITKEMFGFFFDHTAEILQCFGMDAGGSVEESRYALVAAARLVGGVLGDAPVPAPPAAPVDGAPAAP